MSGQISETISFLDTDNTLGTEVKEDLSPVITGLDSGKQQSPKSALSLKVFIDTISPVTKPKKFKKGHGAQKATILTSSPYKTLVQLVKELKDVQEKLRVEKKMVKNKPNITLKADSVVAIKKERNVGGKQSVRVKRNLDSDFVGQTSCLPTTSNQCGIVIEVNKKEWRKCLYHL